MTVWRREVLRLTTGGRTSRPPGGRVAGWPHGRKDDSGRAAQPHQKLVPMLNWKVSNSSCGSGRKFFE
jgi:hypothetical protein